ncbi:hypothetical protein I4F81_011256 [Pyropia yezoensis]|uniref:Uncharacterized protein n=1 Tax=Pyropia yezoensis TaxID=2788 RepID=A0ACC3CG26_PYRYE|nr:hypothetical protein I4F81_011256 [Neopyropia yezoensis]
MFTAVPHGVDDEKLSKWLESGVEKEEPGESCCFISSKRVKDRSCKRHGGLLLRMRRAAGGQCPVRVEVHTRMPLPKSGTVRVIVVLRGVHSRIFPVCKPSGETVHKIVADNPCLSIRYLQSAIADASEGAPASSEFVWKLRHHACLAAHPFGQDLLGVMDLRRRSGKEHPYVKSFIDRDDFTFVVLQNEEQARLSGKLRQYEADSTLEVVAPGAAKDGFAAETVASSGKRAFDWNQFSIVGLVAPAGVRAE